MNTARLKASVAPWSADLSNLESKIRRIDPYADSYHFDVSAGAFAASFLLFFPDLLNRFGIFTTIPFEVHLITHKRERWVEVFLLQEPTGFSFIRRPPKAFPG